MDLLESILTTENEASRKNKRRCPLWSILILSSLSHTKKMTEEPMARQSIIRLELPLDASCKPPGRPQIMRQFLFVFLAVAGFAVAVDGFWVEPYRIEVTHSSVLAPLTAPLKIAHLSDLHSSGLGRRERQLLGLLDAEQPDLIVITGDTLTPGNHSDTILPIL
jgi:hypothetical protein